jgi:hypothetical protein
MKNKKLFFITIACILLLGLITSWQLKNFGENLATSDIPKFEMPNLESLLFPERGEDQEFISPDGKLKLKYPSDWMRGDKSLLEYFNQEIIKEEAKILFFGQKLDVKKGTFASLVIQKFTFLEKETGAIIQKFKDDSRERGSEMEAMKIEEKEKEVIFEAQYTKQGEPDLYSKEKMIRNGEENYLITFITLASSWSNFEEEANQILDSVNFSF